MLEVTNLSKRYPTGRVALRRANLKVEAGEFVIVLGSNGSGKSTLLRCVARLIDPTEGAVRVADHDMTRLRGRDLRQARTALAMISQHGNLVKRRSVLANVACGALGRIGGWRSRFGLLPADELEAAHHYLAEVSLQDLWAQRASTLSGGQAQRCAIARALAQKPKVLLADEPVASLDPEAAEEIMRLLRRLASQDKLAVICVLHQPELAFRYADRVIGIKDGSIEFDLPAADAQRLDISTLYTQRAA
ncbi:MAG TPA: phosphonate ABC transporter ATP-binding protein [Stellaceae bacterium]|nr:phosphonate ABC transporter ATP-binding protein [Stellaceae bacterium]